MFDQIGLDLPQYSVYLNSRVPLAHYYKEHREAVLSEKEIEKLLPYARQTDFVLNTFREIVDDLSYNKEQFEQFIFTLDDDFDMLSDFVKKLNPSLKSHYELKEISEKILDNLIKTQHELGLIVSQNENHKI